MLTFGLCTPIVKVIMLFCIFLLFASLSPLPLLEVVDRGDGIDDGAGTY